ncbi:hypothetical protein ACIBCC_29620 [Streptomyces griseus]|uniref:hypothetical protein n=1 Tax=Streptomyces griseus TaxID=1911 RepID=UPI0037988D8B
MDFRLDEREKSRSFAAYLKGLEDRLAALESANPLTHASIESGSLDVYDDEGTLRASLGMQGDGTAALVPHNSQPPPTPTPPAVEPALSGLVVTWDGDWADSDITPADYATIQIHVSGAGAEFLPDLSTLVATISAPLGGSATVAVEGYAAVWVRLVATNTAAMTGPPSTATQSAARQAVGQDLIDSIIDETKLAEDAVTAAKIALGAVGSTALAEGAVLEDKLAKAAVTLDKIGAGAVTLNALGGAVSDLAAQRYVDAMGDPTAWSVLQKAATAKWEHLDGVQDAPTGRTVGQATGIAAVRGRVQVPYDPDVLYRVSARVRTVTPAASGADTLFIGVAGVAADGVTLVNRLGAASHSSQHHFAALNNSLPSSSGWVTYVGYLRGRVAPGAQASYGVFSDPRAPGQVHADVRFITPMLWLNYGAGSTSGSGVMQVDAVTVEALKTGVVDGTNLVIGSVAAGHLAADSVIAGKVAADAIGAREILAEAIGVNELAAGAVTARAVAAGSITAEKLTIVGGSNILSDPSFEGAYTAALVSALPWATQDKTLGNGSQSSLRIDATSAAPASRPVELTLLPVSPGDQLYLATDYYASANWTGAEINMQVRWETAAGAILSYGKAATTSPVRGAWTRLSTSPNPVTAPPNAAVARVRVESGNGTAGTVWFDNSAVRPVVPGVQLADGSITAPKIVALSITAEKLAALAVTAEKIAALAITTAKLDALAVTADKLAVNSVTATKIAAGAIEATHIKAGAITAEKIDADALNGKIITGAVVQTAATGDRVVVTNDGGTGMVAFWNSANRLSAQLASGTDSAGMQALVITGPDPNGAFWTGRPKVTLGADGTKGQITLAAEKVVVASSSAIPFSAPPVLEVQGYLDAANISAGRVRITPSAPNVPTSITVTGLKLPQGATAIYAYACAVTTVPGTQVLGVGTTDPTARSVTIWLTRTNTNLTSVDYYVIATG